MKMHTRFSCAVALLVAVAITDARALTVYYVDVARTGTSANTGLSWTDAYTNLWQALTLESTAREFWVADGTYVPTNLNAGVRGTISGDILYGGFSGSETSVSQRDWKTYPAILSGDVNGDTVSDIIPDVVGLNDAIERPLFIVSSGSGAQLDGFTLQYGNNVGTHTRHGGALYVANTDLTIRNCIFKNNTSSRGGAIAVRGGATATRCVIDNTLFYGNVCASNNLSIDGGIYTFQGSGATGLYLTNCTFAANSIATQPNGQSSATGLAGADVRLHSLLSGGVMFKNCIFWSATNSISEGIVPTITYSDVLQLSGTHAGTGNINADPSFVGGSDYRLLSGSPAIDTGDNTGVAAKDLDFGTRIQGATVDMGAYEKVAVATADLTVNDSPSIGFDVQVVRVGTFNDTTDFTLTGLDQGAMTLTATTPKAISADERYVFAKWNDGSTDYTANPLTGYNLNGNKTFTLTFEQQFRATNSVEGTGTLLMSPANGWTNAGAIVTYSNPLGSGGFGFDYWKEATGDSPLSSNMTLNVTLTCPTNIVAVFQASGIQVQVLASPSEAGYMADGDTRYASHFYSWADASTHYLAVTSPAVASATKQYRLNNWNDNDIQGPVSTTNWSYDVIGPGPLTVTASFDTYYKLTTSIVNGTITNDPPSPDGYYLDGTVVQLYADPAGANYDFGSWSGDASGTANPVTVTVNGAKSVTATMQQLVLVDRTAVGGANNGTSWGDAYTNLWDALALSGAGLQFRVAEGIYIPTNWAYSRATLEANDSLLGGFPAGGGALSSRDWAGHPTYISGSELDDGHSDITFSNVYHETPFVDYPLLFAESAGVKIDGFTLQYGANISSHTRYGSALYVNGGDTTLRNCVIRQNWALRGAIAVKGSSTDFTMDNCLVYANSNLVLNTAGGAGLYTDTCRSIAITNCTFAGNTSYAASGDDVRFHSGMTGPVNLRNSIFWSPTAIGNANVSSSSSTNYCNIRNFLALGTGNLSTDPLFVDAANNDYHLQVGSPSVDSGQDAGVSARDLDYEARIQAAAVDMGALEGAETSTSSTSTSSTTSTTTSSTTSTTTSSTTTSSTTSSSSSTTTSTTSSTTTTAVLIVPQTLIRFD